MKFTAFSLTTLLAIVLLVTLSNVAQAVPVFARQTGQPCASCHAGGQFPELTPFGRNFKLTGYTMGNHVVPFSVMGVLSRASIANTSKSDDPTSDFQKNDKPLFGTGSLFIAGKVTDNIGGFAQITYDNYESQSANGDFRGHSGADNMDIRYANHFTNDSEDIIAGVSLNNNPSITDPWNTAAAWMQYVPVASPTSHQFIDGNAPYPSYGTGGNLAGLNAYAFWNRTVYTELGFFKTADKSFSFMSAGIDNADTTKLQGSNNPYWRLAVAQEWGPHNFMVGTSGMVAHIYDAGSDTSDPNNLGYFINRGLDARYQYLGDSHTITAQFAYMRQHQDYSTNSLAGSSPYFLADGVTAVDPFNSSDTTKTLRTRISYIYKLKYGGSLSLFNLGGTTNTLNQTSGYDSSGLITTMDPNATGITSTRVNGNLTGNPATRGITYEAFWMPLEYVRVGVQYTAYTAFNGASHNYDGFGRNAADNNTLYFYVWGAY